MLRLLAPIFWLLAPDSCDRNEDLMNCCTTCGGLESQFDRRRVARKLAEYRAHGPDPTSRMLVDAILAQRPRGSTMLDIGGGVGALQHALLAAGLDEAVGVDASQAYIAAATEEAARRGYAERVRFQHGDFVALADQIAPADIVTLDRAICCYPDMPALVGQSAAKARLLYGLVYPRDTWWLHAARIAINGAERLQRSAFRFFVHPTAAVDALVRSHGFAPAFQQNAGVWQVALYRRVA